MLVPQRAVQELQNQYNVAIVGSDNKVAFKTVTVGPRDGQPLGDRERPHRHREGRSSTACSGCATATVVTAKPAPAAPQASGQAAPRRRRRGALADGQVLRQPAHRGDGDLHHHGDAGPRGDAGAADRAVPRDRAADGAGHHDVRRRERHRRRGGGRDAARAEDQRRRERDLHEVDQRQRRHVDAEGLLRGGQQPRHGQRPDAEPRVGSDAAAAAVGQELRRRGQEGAGRSRCWSSRSSRRTGRTTTTSCPTTRRSTSTTTSRASPASARSTCSAAATTRCACGCGPTASPSSASPCPTSSTRSTSRTS